MDGHPESLGNERSKGEVVISRKVVNGNPPFHHFPERMEHVKIVGSDSLAVFYPEIEEIAKDVERCSFCRNCAEK
jgi:hypothetical protein